MCQRTFHEWAVRLWACGYGSAVVFQPAENVVVGSFTTLSIDNARIDEHFQSGRGIRIPVAIKIMPPESEEAEKLVHLKYILFSYAPPSVQKNRLVLFLFGAHFLGFFGFSSMSLRIAQAQAVGTRVSK